MLMFSEEVFLDDTNIKQGFMTTFGSFLGRISQNFSDAKKQNLIRQDISEQNLIMMYLGMFLPIAASLIVFGQEVEVISLVEVNWDTFLRGILPR